MFVLCRVIYTVMCVSQLVIVISHTHTPSTLYLIYLLVCSFRRSFVTPAVIGPDDVFLDSNSGDFFQLDVGPVVQKRANWVPVGSTGSHLHDVNANNKTQKYGVRPPSPRKKVRILVLLLSMGRLVDHIEECG